VVVTHAYEATLQDELVLNVGDKVYIVKEFDDGWALGIHKETEKEGAFPLICTESLPYADEPRNKEVRISKRVSSVFWEKESHASSVNPFFGKQSPNENPREAGLNLPSDEYYDELDLDLPDRR
jgi:hypothetical protein